MVKKSPYFATAPLAEVIRKPGVKLIQSDGQPVKGTPASPKPAKAGQRVR